VTHCIAKLAERDYRIGMADFFNIVMLVCAAVGSMAFGVLAAYGVFRVGFAMMRSQKTMPTVKQQPEMADVL